MTTKKTLGQLAFEAYWAKRGPHMDGASLPTWDVLAPEVQQGWEAAADAIREECAKVADAIATAHRENEAQFKTGGYPDVAAGSAACAKTCEDVADHIRTLD